jgi:hypothetical protein
MAETKQDWEIYAGENHTFRCFVADKNNAERATDLTSATITWILKQGSSTILTKTVGSGITLASDPTTGYFDITWTAANGASLVGVYNHEARVTLASGTIATTFTGTLNVRATLIP